jgi:LPXTG-motif cell wall-anchored protein
VDAAPAEEYAAPVEEYVPPAEGDYQAYADEGNVEPVPVAEEPVVDAPTQQEQVLKLPSTGAGIENSMPLAAAAGAVAVALGATSLRRRLLT